MPHKTTPRDRAVIAKYVLEAHGKERQLETALQAQIVGAKAADVEEALVDHLAVTRKQIAALEERLAELGESGKGLPGAAAVEAGAALVSTVANKSLALAKGPVQLLRGTSPADNELRNLRDCYWNEAEEIAHYLVIEDVASHLGDTKTARLAREHRKEEETMQKTLESLIKETTRTVAETEGTLPVRPQGKAGASDTPSVATRAKRKAAGTQAGR
jgi:ferritin-like metal-binding protein YciE